MTKSGNLGWRSFEVPSDAAKIKSGRQKYTSALTGICVYFQVHHGPVHGVMHSQVLGICMPDSCTGL